MPLSCRARAVNGAPRRPGSLQRQAHIVLGDGPARDSEVSSNRIRPPASVPRRDHDGRSDAARWSWPRKALVRQIGPCARRIAVQACVGPVAVMLDQPLGEVKRIAHGEIQPLWRPWAARCGPHHPRGTGGRSGGVRPQSCAAGAIDFSIDGPMTTRSAASGARRMRSSFQNMSSLQRRTSSSARHWM